jgi:hypothetical protein
MYIGRPAIGQQLFLATQGEKDWFRGLEAG